MVTVLLEENDTPLSAAHASILLVAIFNALGTTVWFLVVIYIAKSFPNNDTSTFLILPRCHLLPPEKDKVSTSLCGISKSVSLLCDVVPSTLPFLFHCYHNGLQHLP